MEKDRAIAAKGGERGTCLEDRKVLAGDLRPQPLAGGRRRRLQAGGVTRRRPDRPA